MLQVQLAYIEHQRPGEEVIEGNWDTREEIEQLRARQEGDNCTTLLDYFDQGGHNGRRGGQSQGGGQRWL